MSLFRRKDISALQAEVSSDESLKRALGALNLVTLGIGAIIGAGIFVLTGQAAANYAGPAIVYSFILAGTACALAGLCYAEFAAMIPIAGSAYTYGYATLGEFVAWIIGWDLILEYLFAASHRGGRVVGVRGVASSRISASIFQRSTPRRPTRTRRQPTPGSTSGGCSPRAGRARARCSTCRR